MTFLAAVVQMNSTEDKQANLACAARLAEEAARRGASMVVLPEMFACLGRAEAMLAAGEDIPGATSDFLAKLSLRLKITLVGGSIPERSKDAERVFNTSLVFGANGALLGKYRKLHLFDVELPGGRSYRESDWSLAGESTCVLDSPIARLGLAICYDLRFGELFRILNAAGAQVVALPSAFTYATGSDHWEVLLRARAIENQCYVLAANQFGTHGEKLVTYGRSMIVDPWGIVLATAADGPGVALAEINLDRVRQVRAQMPQRLHRSFAK